MVAIINTYFGDRFRFPRAERALDTKDVGTGYLFVNNQQHKNNISVQRRIQDFPEEEASNTRVRQPIITNRNTSCGR